MQLGNEKSFIVNKILSFFIWRNSSHTFELRIPPSLNVEKSINKKKEKNYDELNFFIFCFECFSSSTIFSFYAIRQWVRSKSRKRFHLFSIYFPSIRMFNHRKIIRFERESSQCPRSIAVDGKLFSCKFSSRGITRCWGEKFRFMIVADKRELRFRRKMIPWKARGGKW